MREATITVTNPLTGDFDAVLQVSGRTINRLLASIHQNGFVNPNLPSFPHSVWIRIGDDYSIDGVRGSMQAQLSVPNIELIDGAIDRFFLSVGIRVWYKPDTGSEPLPAFIHGTVRAEYRIEDIDPNCAGWARIASRYLWVRVIEDSVRFDGTASEDLGSLGSEITIHASEDPSLQAANQEKITRQLSSLLATEFAAAPHPVSERFRRGSMRSLSPSPDSSAVALAMALGGEPAGDIASVDNLFLEDSDFAIAVAREYILSLVDPVLAQIVGFNTSFHVHVSTPWPLPDIDTVYHVHINPPSVDWQPHDSFAVIKIRGSGSAHTDSVLADATFDVDQDLVFSFDAAGERLWLAVGSRSVNAHAGGLGSGEVSSGVSGAVNMAVKALVEGACAAAQPTLDDVTARKQELTDQLRSIDDQADASIDGAAFLADGLVLRGTIPLAPRRHTVVSFEKTFEQDGYSALASWIPGGLIDKLEWTWGSSQERLTGAATHDDRFVLRRSRGSVGRFQMAIPSVPLPGIDGTGSVCLTVKGRQVDAVSGQLVAAQTSSCMRFGLPIMVRAPASAGRLLVRDLQQPKRGTPPREVALVAPGGTQISGANTLMLYVDEALSADNATTLRRGLEEAERDDAGLNLLVLYKDGRLPVDDSRVAAEIEQLGSALGVATLVNEDVRGGWAAALALPAGSGQQGWRLMSPDGGVTWMHDGHLSADQLASALHSCLIPSPPPRPEAIGPPVEVGAQLPVTALNRKDREIPVSGTERPRQRDCPPLPVHRPGVAGSVVSFVQSRSAASDVELRKLADQYGQDQDGRPLVVIVVDGVDAPEAESMKNELGIDFAMLADRSGAIADQLGVRAWPTTFTLNQVGIISAVEVGAAYGGRGTEG